MAGASTCCSCACQHSSALQRPRSQPWAMLCSQTQRSVQAVSLRALSRLRAGTCSRRAVQVVAAGSSQSTRSTAVAEELHSTVLETDDWVVSRVQGPDAPATLSQAAALLADAFNRKRRQGLFNALGFAKYRADMLARVLWRYQTLGPAHTTLVARQRGQQALGGAAEVTLETASPEVAEALGCAAGTRFAVLSNMVVDQALRKRGLGGLLLRASEVAAASLQSPILALYVYKYNDAAIRLYESGGYTTVEAWEDPEWARAADLGRTGKPRRLLMTKQLSS